MKNIINWFEIPVSDFDRAVQFYENVFQATFRREAMAAMEMAIFPYTEPQPGGALVKFGHYQPSSQGAIVYLHTPDLKAALKRVENAGGKCLFGPEILPDDIGTIALIVDSEGYRVGLHQPA